MNFLKNLILFCFIAALFSNNLFSQTNLKIGVLHFNSEGINPVTIKSAEYILKQEIAKLNIGETVIENYNYDNNSKPCIDVDCAVEIGTSLNVDRVVTCNLLRLGKKIVVQYSLIDISMKKKMRSGSIVSTSVEDLDNVMKRMALSVTSNKSVKETAEIGRLVKDESKKEVRRSGFKYFGLAIGYFMPSSGIADEERSSTFDLKIGAETDDLTYGLQLFGRNGFGVNIYSAYLFSRKDICPYFGGGLGFHWLNAGYQNANYIGLYDEDTKKGDGLEFLINGGVRFFHTYKLQIVVEFSYSHTFNDFNSNAFTTTIGVLL